MSELMYVAPREIWEQCVGLFEESHYLVLDDGSLLICARFKDRANELAWRTQPGINWLRDGEIPDYHLDKMKSLGVQKGHTLQDLERMASRIHPLVSRTGTE
jgi:hypothetical protein